MNARQVAYDVLYDVEINGNYSNMAINKHFKDKKISLEDKKLATEIIYGTIENRTYLDYVINKFSKIKVKKMSDPVRLVLRMGTYQVLCLNGVSDYAAVDESVKMIKKVDIKSSGFVNAVLRNISRRKDALGDIKLGNKMETLATKYSYNSWILSELKKDYREEFGEEFVEDFLEAASEKPELYVRVNTIKTNFDTLKAELEKNEIICNKTPYYKGALQVKNIRNVENEINYKKGYYTIQDISSMMASLSLNPTKGSKVLDICAAPGGKSTHLAELMENTGEILACDKYEHKLKLIENSAKRLGVKNIKTELQDATVFDESKVDQFDYVLADVPCSGMGIVRRKPEIKFKKKEDVQGIENLQFEILENAAKYTKPGGVIVYSTCTIFKRENIDVVNKFLKENKNYHLEEIDNINLDIDSQKNGYIEIFPNIHGMDGFFIAKIKKLENK